MRKLNDAILVVAISLVSLVALEIGYKHFVYQEKEIHNPYWFTYHPFLGYTQTPNARREWVQLEHDGSVSPGVLKTNNFGFVTPNDFDLFTPYQKRLNERVVIVTGGSAMMGVGVPNNEQTTAYLLEKFLNENQTQYDYTVVNLANGGWKAYNEYIALDLYGKFFDPDWIITMDGSNDLTQICFPRGEGGVFMSRISLSIQDVVENLLTGVKNPKIYISEFENLLIENSTIYRDISGRTYHEITPRKLNG